MVRRSELLRGAQSHSDFAYLSLQAGVDLALGPQWSLNLDVKKVRIRTDL